MSRTRKILIILLVALLLWFVMPVPFGTVHVGILLPAAILLILLAAVIWWPKINGFFARHKVLKWVAVLITAVCVWGAVIPLGMMAAVCLKTPPENCTVIVAGCQVNGKTPSLMLADRCDAAYEYLAQNPKSACVASGGQGRGEDISEARAIADYLIAKGIAKERIYLEDASSNTRENMDNTARLIREKGLNQNVAVATDGFHEWRCAYGAKKAGLAVNGSLPCATRWYLAPGYWVRDAGGVWLTLLAE